MKYQATLLTVLICLVSLSCGEGQAPEPNISESTTEAAPPTLSFQRIEWNVPKRSRFPVIASSQEGDVYAAWTQSGQPKTPHRLLIAKLTEDGWSPHTVAAKGANWFVNWTDTPAITVDGLGSIALTFLEKLGQRTFAYGIRHTLSHDGGKTWSEPAHLQDDLSETEHGFASLLGRTKGGFDAVWLDGRYTVAKAPMTIHTASFDVQGKRQSERSLDNRTCECCSTDLASRPDGGLIAVWRDRSEKEIRDISYSIRPGLHGDWSEPRLLHRDNWYMPS